jgi:hypothetical protein
MTSIDSKLFDEVADSREQLKEATAKVCEHDTVHVWTRLTSRVLTAVE